MENQKQRYSALWRKLDGPGHEAGRLEFYDASWHLTGTAVFLHERRPCLLDYHVICDEKWGTMSGKIAGWMGDTTVAIDIRADGARRWRLNGAECPGVEGCVDLDLNFSPSTNLLPLRRLQLSVGQTADVRAAWLRFPDFALVPLEQTYHRVAAALYAYESRESGFSAQLRVNAEGFVTCYPGLWEIEDDAR